MGSIVVVTGCPGSGKTTLAAALARASSRGLHLSSDLFYGFPARPIDPTTPESHEQNTVIIRALARAARAFAEGGYDVFLDGIFGPWFLPVLRKELAGFPDVSYLVLRVSEREALRRVREREGQGESARVRQMVKALADLGPWTPHALDVEGVSPNAVVALVLTGLGEGRFRLRR